MLGIPRSLALVVFSNTQQNVLSISVNAGYTLTLGGHHVSGDCSPQGLNTGESMVFAQISGPPQCSTSLTGSFTLAQ